MGKGGDALVVCSDKSLGIGITIWDVDTGDHLLHIPTCASPSHGLLCLRKQFLVASQIHRHGSVGGGAIFIWALNKPQLPLRSYPVEAIVPLSCTKDGIYLAGGALSGNAYLWEIASGRLLKTWQAHDKSLNCLLFSNDDSLLISGSNDGMICVWSVISLLDMADSGSLPSLLHYSSEHRSSVTGLLNTSGSSSSVLVSSSLDGTCKVWDFVSGRLIQTQVYPVAITAIVLDPGEQLLFCGSVDGRIFVNRLDIGLLEDPFFVAQAQSVVLKEHNGAITALAFSESGLISASEDCTICMWDVVNWVIIRKFNHRKGAVTNLTVIPQSSLLSVSNHQRVSNQLQVSMLDKYPQPASSSKEKITLPSSCCSLKEKQISLDFRSTDSLNQHISDFQLPRFSFSVLEYGQKDGTPAAMQMKVETCIENRIWATRMTKHVMEMNKHLQSRLLDLMQCRLLWPTEIDTPSSRKRKMLKIESPLLQGEEKPQSST
ncbi:protein ROOT INITIATION DEFECTIVE 3-like isoform X1 [Corylus avellana]|uniref:protein ROOT INITIATION DEFECTIVE 3-like isoform X1 n=1 Tax=Corylus avellana TaxID=13451 RepID=UPI00286D4047|nr:protein ROOT INITIATION DEFECTIVE 3-like isoform X1 [Corylus avellana]